MKLIKNTCFTLMGVIIGATMQTKIALRTTEFTPLEYFILTVIFLLLIVAVEIIEEPDGF